MLPSDHDKGAVRLKLEAHGKIPSFCRAQIAGDQGMPCHLSEGVLEPPLGLKEFAAGSNPSSSGKLVLPDAIIT